MVKLVTYFRPLPFTLLVLIDIFCVTIAYNNLLPLKFLLLSLLHGAILGFHELHVAVGGLLYHSFAYRKTVVSPVLITTTANGKMNFHSVSLLFSTPLVVLRLKEQFGIQLCSLGSDVWYHNTSAPRLHSCAGSWSQGWQ